MGSFKRGFGYQEIRISGIPEIYNVPDSRFTGFPDILSED